VRRCKTTAGRLVSRFQGRAPWRGAVDSVRITGTCACDSRPWMSQPNADEYVGRAQRPTSRAFAGVADRLEFMRSARTRSEVGRTRSWLSTDRCRKQTPVAAYRIDHMLGDEESGGRRVWVVTTETRTGNDAALRGLSPGGTTASSSGGGVTGSTTIEVTQLTGLPRRWPGRGRRGSGKQEASAARRGHSRPSGTTSSVARVPSLLWGGRT